MTDMMLSIARCFAAVIILVAVHGTTGEAGGSVTVQDEGCYVRAHNTICMGKTRWFPELACGIPGVCVTCEWAPAHICFFGVQLPLEGYYDAGG